MTLRELGIRTTGLYCRAFCTWMLVTAQACTHVSDGATWGTLLHQCIVCYRSIRLKLISNVS